MRGCICYIQRIEKKKREGWEEAIVAEDWRGWGKDPKKKTAKNLGPLPKISIILRE
jgi:hypothetical protein